MQRQKLFYGPWWVLFGCTIAQMFGTGPTLQFSFGIFVKPITAEFGWSRGTTAMALSVALTVLAICTPIVGRMVDRWGVRRVAITAIPLFSLSFAAISLTNDSPIVFILLYGLAGCLVAGKSGVVYVKSISGWFDERRGLALGISLAGVGIGTAIMPWLVNGLIDRFGWRGAYVGLAAVTFVGVFTAVTLFVREAPGSGARSTRTAAPSSVPGLTVKAAFASVKFWLIVVAIVLVAMVMQGTIVHLVPMLTDRGMNTKLAVGILSSLGLATIAGRLVVGYMLDRVHAPYVAAVFFMLPLVSLALLFSGATGVAPLISVIILGFGLGAELDLLGYLVSRYFGLRAFGELYGYLYAVFVIGSAIGPYVMGVTFDITHTYDVALLGFGAALVAAALLILRLGAYPYPPPKALVGQPIVAT
jgi:MFS family permease